MVAFGLMTTQTTFFGLREIHKSMRSCALSYYYREILNPVSYPIAVRYLAICSLNAGTRAAPGNTPIRASTNTINLDLGPFELPLIS